MTQEKEENVGIDEGNKSQRTKDRDNQDKDLGKDLKDVPQGTLYILNPKDKGYEKHGKKCKVAYRICESSSGPNIKSTYKYLKCDGDSCIIVMEGLCSILLRPSEKR